MSSQVDSPGQELAKLLARLTDRILPDTSAREKPAHWSVRYGITFIGAIIWSLTALLVAFLFVVVPGLRRLRPDQSQTFQDPFQYSIDYTVDWQFWIILVAFFSSVLFTILIAISVKRGTALSFFLWGLSVPTLAMTILKFAFLFDRDSSG